MYQVILKLQIIFHYLVINDNNDNNDNNDDNDDNIKQ